MEAIFEQSLELTLWLQSLAGWLDPVMEFFTFLSNEEFYLLVMPVVLWVFDYRLGFRMGVMLLLTSGLNPLLKMTFRQPRPYWVRPEAGVVSSPASGYGIPSGHAQFSISVYGFFAVIFKKRWITALVVFVVFMIGLSRVYLGEHFYIDVLAGWLIGAVVLYLFVKLEPRVRAWFAAKNFGAKTLWVLAFSVGTILLGAVVINTPADYQVPQEWVNNALTAFPEEPIAPLNLSDVITSAATLFGLAAGYFWVAEKGGFNANSGYWWQRLVRFLLGLVGVVILWMGLGAVFPDQEELVSWSLRYLRYALTGAWITGGVPLLSIRFGLAKSKAD